MILCDACLVVVNVAMARNRITSSLLFFALVAMPALAMACPNCKDALATDPDAANLARGLYYSILFMLAMPALILTGLGSLFYWEVRRAKRRQAATASATAISLS
jgi:heme/copper-type cytochrome/quinol oxidase subunit 2